MGVTELPVGSWSLIKQGCASWAVLAPEASGAGHVVIRHCRRFYWLKSFIRSVTSARDRETEFMKLGLFLFLSILILLTREFLALPWVGWVASVLVDWSSIAFLL